MGPMRLGRPLVHPVLALVGVVAATLTGCGLFDRGSTLEDAFEYLPADTFSVAFADRQAMAERLGADDLDPRDVSDDDLDDYVTTLREEEDTAVAGTALSRYLQVMKDAPLNELDVSWEVQATWGDDPADADGSATVWKVGDDLDFDALAEDLHAKGYDESSVGDLSAYSVEISAADDGTIGGVYPATMLNVLLDEDEQLVVSAVDLRALEEVADVVADDADSLADAGGMDDLVDAADGDPEVARLETEGSRVCFPTGQQLPDDLRAEYGDLGRPEARALFVSGDDDPPARLVLQYDDGDAAKDDLEARETLIEDGKELRSQRPFDDLGDFSVERDGDLLVIDEDFDGGPRQAVIAEESGGGPGTCFPPAPA